MGLCRAPWGHDDVRSDRGQTSPHKCCGLREVQWHRSITAPAPTGQASQTGSKLSKGREGHVWRAVRFGAEAQCRRGGASAGPANERSSSLLNSALQFLDASKDGDFAGVLEHKEHWKAFAGIYGLGQSNCFDAKQFAPQNEFGIGGNAQAVDFMPLFVQHDKLLGEACR